MLLQDVVDVDGSPESLLVVMDAIFFQPGSRYLGRGQGVRAI